MTKQRHWSIGKSGREDAVNAAIEYLGLGGPTSLVDWATAQALALTPAEGIRLDVLIGGMDAQNMPGLIDALIDEVEARGGTVLSTWERRDDDGEALPHPTDAGGSRGLDVNHPPTHDHPQDEGV